ncbi:Hsp20/alpha crystallin family protein [Acetohalobium arabaticum]|uniref:Heat shock protein Hsp20 n=1 Tax=Acetohalobium arabaticum (strain ATCC 49924 / DSM 5501 / Z-7288) TaxID=574087 RepID=D9QQJ9_ACEAZ|nr:Hsp20/alpha crystallin family protein [Acetohalobium arabaticum]ADL12790.1 heat shock protein Hsp20 [Acetohalobium arabaticum DSM 5501]
MANNFNLQNRQGNHSTGIANYNQPNYVSPQVDVVEDDRAVHYIYELPGVNLESLNVELSQESIFIEANIDSAVQNQMNFLHQERRKGAFFRKMSLPTNVDNNNAEANFTHGLLKVTFPKTNNF